MQTFLAILSIVAAIGIGLMLSLYLLNKCKSSWPGIIAFVAGVLLSIACAFGCGAVEPDHNQDNYNYCPNCGYESYELEE